VGWGREEGGRGDGHEYTCRARLPVARATSGVELLGRHSTSLCDALSLEDEWESRPSQGSEKGVALVNTECDK